MIVCDGLQSHKDSDDGLQCFLVPRNGDCSFGQIPPCQLAQRPLDRSEYSPDSPGEPEEFSRKGEPCVVIAISRWQHADRAMESVSTAHPAASALSTGSLRTTLAPRMEPRTPPAPISVPGSHDWWWMVHQHTVWVGKCALDGDATLRDGGIADGRSGICVELHSHTHTLFIFHINQ